VSCELSHVDAFDDLGKGVKVRYESAVAERVFIEALFFQQRRYKCVFLFHRKFAFSKRQRHESRYQWSEHIGTLLDDRCGYFVQRRRRRWHQANQLVDLVGRRRRDVGKHISGVSDVKLQQIFE
jgi:hypothetical protein